MMPATHVKYPPVAMTTPATSTGWWLSSLDTTVLVSLSITSALRRANQHVALSLGALSTRTKILMASLSVVPPQNAGSCQCRCIGLRCGKRM